MSDNETTVTTGKKNAWATWMHIAGVGYAVGLWIIVMALTMNAPFGVTVLGGIAFTVGTFAFVGGWGRYLATKK